MLRLVRGDDDRRGGGGGFSSRACEDGKIAGIVQVLLDFARAIDQTLGMAANPPEKVEERSTLPPASGDTLDLALGQFAIERRDDCSPQTLREVASLVQDLCRHAGCGPERIRRGDVVAFLEWCATTGRQHRIEGRPTRRRVKAGAKTRRNYLSALRGFFDWAIQAELCPGPNPCETVRSPRVLRRQGRAFTPAEIAAIIRAAPPERSVLYRVLWVTGARVGSLCGSRDRGGLPTSHYHLELDPPHIEVPAAMMKSGQEIRLALDEGTAAALRALVASKPDHAPSLPLFRRPSRKQLHADCRAAGIALTDGRGRGAGLHCFRRGCSTGLLDLGFDPKVAQLQLGHSDVATTLRNYTDRGLVDQAKAAAALAACIPGGIPEHPAQATQLGQSYPQSEKDLTPGAELVEDQPASRPMLTKNTTSRALDPRRAPVRDVKHPSLDARPGSTAFACESAPPGAAGMSEWAIQDSNL